jgi:ring-1,2-phenylacetyl-CoA epoxidase subunit PaaD
VNATARLRAAVATVRDPEIRVLTVEELGIVRDVDAEGGRPTVTVTPTYVGCPAMDLIRSDIVAAARDAGFPDVEVRTVLSPAWTTDWLSDEARAKLAGAGITPPACRSEGRKLLPLMVLVPPKPRCPRCGAADTDEVSRFGSTACKSLWRCNSCREPFEQMKEH